MNKREMEKLEEYDNPDLAIMTAQFIIRNLIRDYHIKDIEEEFIIELVRKDGYITAEEVSRKIIAKRRKGIIDTFLDKDE
jgi:hypothetical protein